jgi:hypothetical protein
MYKCRLWEHGSARLSCHFVCFVVPNAVSVSKLKASSTFVWRRGVLRVSVCQTPSASWTAVASAARHRFCTTVAATQQSAANARAPKVRSYEPENHRSGVTANRTTSYLLECLEGRGTFSSVPAVSWSNSAVCRPQAYV